MLDPTTLINYLWQISLILLLCLCGAIVVIIVRSGLRLPGREFRDRFTKHRKHTRQVDPWKASAQRLTEAKLPNQSDDDEDRPHDTGAEPPAHG